MVERLNSKERRVEFVDGPLRGTVTYVAPFLPPGRMQERGGDGVWYEYDDRGDGTATYMGRNEADDTANGRI